MTKIQRVPLEIPSWFLSCSPEPMAPEGDLETDVANWVVDVIDAGADCRAKLAEVRALVAQP